MLINRLRKFDGRLLGFVGDVAGLRVEILAYRFRMLQANPTMSMAWFRL
jgi:hypothetical protein